MAVGECKDGPVKSRVYDKRTKKTYTSYRFRSVNNITFFHLRQRWYPKGIKVIPTDVKMTPISVLIWYLGDGSLIEASRSYYIKLCTNGFDKDNVECVLFPQLSRYEPSFIQATEKQWWVYIPRRQIGEFLSFIGECPVAEYAYKWKYAEYKREAFKNGTATDFSKIKTSVLTDYLKGDTLWTIHKKYGVEYNLVKYHIKRYERHVGRSHQKSV